MYSRVQNIGVNRIIRLADSSRNRNEELRAFASFITQIRVVNRIKNMINASRNRTELSIIVCQNHSVEVRGFQITSTISQLHSKILIATCAIFPVSMNSQKI